MSWAWKPERASECMNGKVKCNDFWCEKLLSKPGLCRSCKRKQKEQQKVLDEKITE